MQKVQSIREKIRRKLSIHDKNPNFDEVDEMDDETRTRLETEIAEAEQKGSVAPNSFLARLIAHGNKKTDDQLAADGFKDPEPAAGSSSSAAAAGGGGAK